MEYLEIAGRVRACITGRIADSDENLARLCRYAVSAGNGDYLEIGTLFGGSAIAVALAKKEAGLTGKVYCIDPLDGYYIGAINDRGRDISELIDISGYTPSLEILESNADKLGVKLEIIQQKSHPFPKQAKRNYVMAYIDGDHWNDAPLNDWLNVRRIVTKYIVFDNVDRQHPSVSLAVIQAMRSWKLVELENGQAVLENV